MHAARSRRNEETGMVALNWLRGLIAHRPTRIIATALGVGVGVALIASIGTFLSSTNAKMTQRAIARVAVDWQVEAQPGADAEPASCPLSALSGRQAGAPGPVHDVPRPDRDHPGLHPDHGRARVLGLPPGYAAAFPGELRLLFGSLGGVLVAQQTASNLHVAPGDTVTIARPASSRPMYGRGRRRSPVRRFAVPEGRRASRSAAFRPPGQRDPATAASSPGCRHRSSPRGPS